MILALVTILSVTDVKKKGWFENMNTKWEKVGNVGVDAGLIWVGDPCYVLHKKEGEGHPELGKDWGDFCDKLGDDYPIIKNFNGLGIALSSGYGDGVYPVFIKRNSEGRIVKVLVKLD